MAALKIDALQLQDRDFALLRGLFESRVMSADHATALYFDGNYDPAKKRLQKIKTDSFRLRHVLDCDRIPDEWRTGDG